MGYKGGLPQRNLTEFPTCPTYSLHGSSGTAAYVGFRLGHLPRALELPPQYGGTLQNQRLNGRRDPLMAVSEGSLDIVRERPTKIVSNGVIARRLLNVREAAQYLGLEVDTVYKKSRLREVPCVKVGRSLRFDVKALEQYIEQHSIQTID
jgi:excisionase family DNA binding protein